MLLAIKSADVHQEKMGRMFCKWSVGLGLSPLSFTVSNESSKGVMEIESFSLASLIVWPPFTQTAALQGPLPVPPKNPGPTPLPPSFLSPTRHLLLTTSCPICSGVQLRATKAFHWAPQGLTDILENKCETVLFGIFNTCTKAFLQGWWNMHSVTHRLTMMLLLAVSKSEKKGSFENSRFKLNLGFVIIHTQWYGLLSNKKIGDKMHFLGMETNFCMGDTASLTSGRVTGDSNHQGPKQTMHEGLWLQTAGRL